MTIETTYRDHTIRFNENTDEWSCYDVGSAFSSPSLSKVKARIDKMYRDLRKSAAIPCFELSGGYSDRPPRTTEGTLIEYLGPIMERPPYNSPSPDLVLKGYKVAVVATRGGNKQAGRAEVKLHDLMPDTPEAHEALSAARVAYEAVKVAVAAYKEAYDNIPRLTLDDIPDLVKVKETQGSARVD